MYNSSLYADYILLLLSDSSASLPVHRMRKQPIADTCSNMAVAYRCTLVRSYPLSECLHWCFSGVKEHTRTAAGGVFPSWRFEFKRSNAAGEQQQDRCSVKQCIAAKAQHPQPLSKKGSPNTRVCSLRATRVEMNLNARYCCCCSCCNTVAWARRSAKIQQPQE
jgi:hypothetical protein